MVLSENIKAEARRLGFQLVGVTSPEPPLHFDVYEHWLAAGRHGEMSYLATEPARFRRADPRRILPACKSILVLGIRYPSPDPLEFQPGDSHISQPPNRPASQGGIIASYAWGDDYHLILPERLKALVAFIENQVGHPIPNRWYTDTGPILERELAQRAGLGWIGKNTCLINPELGSYFLLAEVLLGIDLPPDAPFLPNRCGSCTRCLEACPTDCILPECTIDASRCISYLTIELHGPIQPALRPQLGNRVFGCDVCQQVCPWNQRFALPCGDPAFAPRNGVAGLDLIQELSLTSEGFNRKFKGSPVKRAKRRGYLRNVAVAVGNSSDPSAVTALSQALLGDPEPLVRSHAAWALGRIGGEAEAALQAAASDEKDPGVLIEIQRALANFSAATQVGFSNGQEEGSR